MNFGLKNMLLKPAVFLALALAGSFASAASQQLTLNCGSKDKADLRVQGPVALGAEILSRTFRSNTSVVYIHEGAGEKPYNFTTSAVEFFAGEPGSGNSAVMLYDFTSRGAVPIGTLFLKDVTFDNGLLDKVGRRGQALEVSGIEAGFRSQREGLRNLPNLKCHMSFQVK